MAFRMINLFKKKHREGLERHDVAGNTFWTWKNVAELPYRRQLRLMGALKSAELGIVRADLLATVDLLKTSLNEQNFVKSATYVSILDSYLQMYSNHAVNLEMADVVILLENEDHLKPDEISSEKKRKLYETNEEVKAFFLSQSLSTLVELKMLSNTLEIEDYLKSPEAKKSEQAFKTLIQASILRSTAKK